MRQLKSLLMALTLVLCNTGVIPFEVAAAMVLGENIGKSSISAIIQNG